MRAAAHATTRFERRVKNIVAVGVLEIVCKPKLGLAINAVLVTPSRDPGPAGTPSAITDMKSLLENTPIGFGAGNKAQKRAAGCQKCLTKVRAG
jgi:hypothetical protein